MTNRMTVIRVNGNGRWHVAIAEQQGERTVYRARCNPGGRTTESTHSVDEDEFRTQGCIKCRTKLLIPERSRPAPTRAGSDYAISVCRRPAAPSAGMGDTCPECGHLEAVHVGTVECPVCRLVELCTPAGRRREARIHYGLEWRP